VRLGRQAFQQAAGCSLILSFVISFNVTGTIYSQTAK
jgi:hypothetical protein